MLMKVSTYMKLKVLDINRNYFVYSDAHANIEAKLQEGPAKPKRAFTDRKNQVTHPNDTKNNGVSCHDQKSTAVTKTVIQEAKPETYDNEYFTCSSVNYNGDWNFSPYSTFMSMSDVYNAIREFDLTDADVFEEFPEQDDFEIVAEPG